MFEAQDENHDYDYEAIPLKNVPPLPPARTSSPTSPMQQSHQYENLPALIAQEDCDTTAAINPGKSTENDEDHGEPTSAISSIDTPTAIPTTVMPTVAMPTIAMPIVATPSTTSSHDMEYEM